jgi:hypothetical protein
LEQGEHSIVLVYMTRTPSTMRAFQRRTHHLDVAGAIKRVVDTPLGQIADNMLLDRHI